ncbi:glycosyltransferase family 2 protein [Aeromonas media]
MRVSVCMATYNGVDYIGEQLSSILSQLGEDDEIIISDDHSTDKTIEFLRQCQQNDNRIKVYINNSGKGYTKNFENALKKATGEFIFLADQDDVWLPGKVDKYLALFDSYDFIVSDCHVVDQYLNITSYSHFKMHQVRSGFFINFIRPRYIGACMAFRKNVLIMALPFPGYQKYIAHDYWLSLIAESNFKVSILEEPYLLYRRHSNNTSTGGIKSKNTLYHKVLVRFITGMMLLRRWLKVNNDKVNMDV